MFNFSLLVKSKEMKSIKKRIHDFLHRVILCGLCINDVEIAMNNILAVEKELNTPTPPSTPTEVRQDDTDVEAMTS